MDKHETFAPNEIVLWREHPDTNWRRLVENLRRQYGEGPFRVVEVEEAKKFPKRFHPQLLHLEMGGEVLPLSGWLFVRALNITRH